MNAVQQVRQALLARAAELQVTGPSEEAIIDALLDQEVQVAAPSEAACRAYYEAHPDAFRPSSIVELDHILFAVTDPIPHEALRAQAEAVLQRLLAGEVSFGPTARSVSNCPSAEIGGNLGQLTQGDVAPEFWRGVMAHGQPGIVPQLVESRFGLHVVRIHRLAPGALLPFEQVRGQIQEALAEQGLRAALHDYAHGLVHPGHADEHAHAHEHAHQHAHQHAHDRAHDQEHQHGHDHAHAHEHSHEHSRQHARQHQQHQQEQQNSVTGGDTSREIVRDRGPQARGRRLQ
jgi:peptidyl-prolyl cis-trans isomerase C